MDFFCKRDLCFQGTRTEIYGYIDALTQKLRYSVLVVLVTVGLLISHVKETYKLEVPKSIIYPRHGWDTKRSHGGARRTSGIVRIIYPSYG